MTTNTTAYMDRVEELRSLPWAQIKDAAELIGYDKPDDEKWSEQAEAIATIEFAAQEVTVEEVEATDSAEEAIAVVEPETSESERFPVAYYRAIGVTIGSDGDKIKTDSNGNIIN